MLQVVLSGNFNAVKEQLCMLSDHDRQARDAQGRCALHLAAENGHTSIAELLVEEGSFGIDDQDKRQSTPLTRASARGHIDCVSLLTSLGASVNMSSPLVAAAFSGRDDVVRCLISVGADVCSVDMSGKTALHAAASRNHATVVDALVRELDTAAAQEYLNYPCRFTGDTALISAVRGQCMASLTALVRAGAKVDWLAVRMAVYCGWYEGSEYLIITFPESLMLSGSDGYSLLHWASLGGHVTIVRFLLNCGASPFAENAYQQTPLHCAASDESADASRQAEVARLLLDWGANAESVDKYNVSPLRQAVQSRMADVAIVLLERGACVMNAADGSGRSVLHDAVDTSDGEGMVAVVELMLRLGADVNAQDHQGLRPFDIAQMALDEGRRHAETVVAILAHYGSSVVRL